MPIDLTEARENCDVGPRRELHLRGGDPPVRQVLLWPFDRPVAADGFARSPRYKSVGLRAWALAVGAAIADALEPLTPRAPSSAARILPYQLAPAVAMAGGAPRVLLADEVGLGKTIQAGWIVADLLERERGARILIAAPAGLRRQWHSELSAWFSIEAIGVDARWLRGMVADIPADVSPWAAPGVYLGSVDFLKRPDVAASLDAHVWDLLVVDEAHAATSPTERYLVLAAVAARARRVVTITATPYSGDAAGFFSMAALGAAGGDPPPLMFRRSREDAGDPRRRRHRFATVRITTAEIRLQRLLERYSRLVWRNAPADVVGDGLVEAALGAPGLADIAAERRWLTASIEAADEAAGVDSKERYLRRLLDRVGREPVIVFTEYRDTLLQLVSALPPSLHLHGGLSASERTAVQAQFNHSGGLLLATDAAAEGLNLQRRCRIVVNFELPWNPARLEQRIGRVDRIGQERGVHAITLVARDTAEDLVIANLARRLARVVATLGEQDRLGAFLTDARTAGMVIGGAVPDEAAASPEPPEAVKREPAVGEEARAAADRLLLRRSSRSGIGMKAGQPEDPAVLVGGLRASRTLANGFVVASRCTARTEDGDLIASRAILFHVACDIARPASRLAARSMAAQAIACLPDVCDTFPEVADWVAGVTGIHERSIDCRLAREIALHNRATETAPVQPGLFDRRALRAAEELSSGERAIHAEHRLRIAALDRGRRSRVSCIPVAVLILWR